MRLFAVFCIIIGMIACNSNIEGGNTSLNPFDSAQTNNPQNIEKLYELGFKYYIGDSVERDTVKAIDLIQKAAELGHIGGETMLAYCYFRGDGVDKNYDECVKARAGAPTIIDAAAIGRSPELWVTLLI